MITVQKESENTSSFFLREKREKIQERQEILGEREREREREREVPISLSWSKTLSVSNASILEFVE